MARKSRPFVWRNLILQKNLCVILSKQILAFFCINIWAFFRVNTSGRRFLSTEFRFFSERNPWSEEPGQPVSEARTMGYGTSTTVCLSSIIQDQSTTPSVPTAKENSSFCDKTDKAARYSPPRYRSSVAHSVGDEFQRFRSSENAWKTVGNIGRVPNRGNSSLARNEAT